MWILTVVILFAAGATGVNIPDDRYEGPYVMENQQGPVRHATEADCENEARTNLERWTATEKHMHQTDGLEVRWRCVPEQRDL